ncbi:double-strand siRNA ribonuclease [Coprinopsis sp. MPI-PUGE-AT-0042]|nr:double-strand siRNA ribonuclease [Coprinopsis sp. MPI-PUGE-AT-0042]
MAGPLDLAALAQRLNARIGPPDDSDERTPPSSPDLPQDFFQRLPRQIRRRLYYAKTLAAQGRAPPRGSGYTTPSETDEPLKSKQLFDMYLVLDIEGTCEFPVRLLGWKDKGEDMSASELVVIDEFRTFVRPTWRPVLSDFCKELTGITQGQVDSAPTFSEILPDFETFMIKNGLIDETGATLARFCFCTDGPFDIPSFIVKQCFISKLPLPWWFKANFIDVRLLLLQCIKKKKHGLGNDLSNINEMSTKRTLNISAQLKVLGLPEFEGRQHSGIDDARNIARILTELGRRGVHLLPNSAVQPNRRWPWMGKKGQVMEEHLVTK